VIGLARNISPYFLNVPAGETKFKNRLGKGGKDVPHDLGSTLNIFTAITPRQQDQVSKIKKR